MEKHALPVRTRGVGHSIEQTSQGRHTAGLVGGGVQRLGERLPSALTRAVPSQVTREQVSET